MNSSQKATGSSSSVARRLNQELKQFVSQSEALKATGGPKDDDLCKWQILIEAPEDSVYAGGKFSVEFEFPSQYPFKPPTLKFLTRIYHPNIDRETGSMCLALLKTESWKPSCKIVDILREITVLLSNPNPDDPLDVDVAQQFQTNYAEFAETARSWTKEHAISS